ncbi:MAG: hypothetical protein BGO21_20985 [Dyadobacter sp. 50-39]|jgi:hypothetical protein|uniref:hypothetical protein n=1 Tax=Dyadobacter sp. 50-39 TaxID=1895756 RepID=UPI0009670C3D|nr:hypothetical protein [Dyadobacter sp. 50-39]OJV19178.1 MAG: hypothetical protein BGO21_20985 [Dyadobacter sp. 50-39]
MKDKNYTGAVPGQERGDSVTAEASRTLENVIAAKAFFHQAESRLLDVSQWHGLAGEALARFILTDQAGNPVEGTASQGLLIKIDIPGPGSESGRGYDWVTIEEIKRVDSNEMQSTALRVRPVAAPGSGKEEPTHFYDEGSTSTFTVTREHDRVTAAIYDRNINPNTEADSLIDKIRNAITGLVGEKVFSKIQWQALVDGLLK